MRAAIALALLGLASVAFAAHAPPGEAEEYLGFTAKYMGVQPIDLIPAVDGPNCVWKGTHPSRCEIIADKLGDSGYATGLARKQACNRLAKVDCTGDCWYNEAYGTCGLSAAAEWSVVTSLASAEGCSPDAAIVASLQGVLECTAIPTEHGAGKAVCDDQPLCLWESDLTTMVGMDMGACKPNPMGALAVLCESETGSPCPSLVTMSKSGDLPTDTACAGLSAGACGSNSKCIFSDYDEQCIPTNQAAFESAIGTTPTGPLAAVNDAWTACGASCTAADVLPTAALGCPAGQSAGAQTMLWTQEDVCNEWTEGFGCTYGDRAGKCAWNGRVCVTDPTYITTTLAIDEPLVNQCFASRSRGACLETAAQQVELMINVDSVGGVWHQIVVNTITEAFSPMMDPAGQCYNGKYPGFNKDNFTIAVVRRDTSHTMKKRRSLVHLEPWFVHLEIDIPAEGINAEDVKNSIPLILFGCREDIYYNMQNGPWEFTYAMNLIPGQEPLLYSLPRSDGIPLAPAAPPPYAPITAAPTSAAAATSALLALFGALALFLAL